MKVLGRLTLAVLVLAAKAFEPPRWQTPAERGIESQGERACRWIETFLVHGEGDFYGQPFKLRLWQRAVIYRILEHRDGRPRWRRVLLGLAKGSGKTELAAAIGLYLTFGQDPIFGLGTADVPIGAASYEQADLLFGAARLMASHDDSALAGLIEAYDTELLAADGTPGRMYRVTSAGGSNDGKRPTAFLADELHEWKERPFVVLENGLAKRANSIGVYITTAGVLDSDSVCERLFLRGQDPDVDSGLLMLWWAADPALDLADPTQLELAIRQASPAADDFWPVERLVQKWQSREVPEHEFRRYHLNQWTASLDAPWLPPDAWAALPVIDEPPEPGEPITLFFDGSYNNDTAALVGCWLRDGELPAIFVVDSWRPTEQRSGTVPVGEVDARVRQSFRRWRVLRFGVDPSGFHREADEWADEYGDEIVIEVPGGQVKRWAAWSSRFYSAVVAGELAHDGSTILAEHVRNAVLRETANGAYIAKERRGSRRKIDVAYAAVGALGLAQEFADDDQPGELTATWL